MMATLNVVVVLFLFLLTPVSHREGVGPLSVRLLERLVSGGGSRGSVAFSMAPSPNWTCTVRNPGLTTMEEQVAFIPGVTNY